MGSSSRRCKSIDDGPCADEVDRHCDISQCWVKPEDLEHIKYVVSVVGQGIGVNNGVEVDCE